MDPSVAAIAACGFLAGGVVKGVIGLGMPVVVLSALALALPLADALSIIAFPVLIANIAQMTRGPHLAELTRRLWPFLIATLLGIAIGGRILVGVDETAAKALLGCMLAFYAAFALTMGPPPPPGRAERWLGPPVGLAAGVIFGATGFYILPGVLWVESLGLGRERFVQALGLCFVTVSVGLGASLFAHDLLRLDLALLSAACLVPALAGMRIGAALRSRTSERAFRSTFHAALLAIGGHFALQWLVR